MRFIKLWWEPLVCNEDFWFSYVVYPVPFESPLRNRIASLKMIRVMSIHGRRHWATKGLAQ